MGDEVRGAEHQPRLVLSEGGDNIKSHLGAVNIFLSPFLWDYEIASGMFVQELLERCQISLFVFGIYYEF